MLALIASGLIASGLIAADPIAADLTAADKESALTAGSTAASKSPADNLSQARFCPIAPDFAYSSEQKFQYDPDAPVEASADSVVSKNGQVSLKGDTRISFQNRTLLAQNAEYNRNTGEVEIAGDLSYESDGVILSSSNAKFDLNQSTFLTGESKYEINLGEKRATGDAATMERSENGNFRLTQATYSTCPPGDKSWFIQAEDIILNTEKGIGTANKITLNFKGVPILAVPTFSFPISPKRKTGLLAPTLAQSESTGFELYLPWYWNIRPNLDATFTPRFMSRRGTQLQSEFRYLNDLGNWRLDTEYLYDDQVAVKADRKRSFARLRHFGGFGEYWSTELDASIVSDKEYFDDLGDNLQVASISHLERRADLRYEDDIYTFLARVQSFQTVDKSIASTNRPYRRLPQLLFNADWPRFSPGIEAGLEAELVYFDRTKSVTGSRFDLEPRLTWPINRDAWFLKPTVTSRFTWYNLNNAGAGNPSQISRAFSTASIDAGLFFDRSIVEKSKILTLEPRLFYLRVPYEDQNQIPVFDSAKLDFNFSQLFRENRFSGSDRVADANQLSLALTSRLIDSASGREQLLASIGQIHYFADRRVTLENNAVDTRDVSDFVAEVSADLENNWNIKSSIQWNPDDSSTVRSSALLSYRPGQDRIINFGHRQVNTANSAETEQLDFSILWPFRDRWRLAGRWNYSLDENTSIESMLGIEYEDCCWAVRFAARRYISDDGLDHNDNYYLQLVLKGLAPLGENIGELLETGILGYQDQY